MQETAKEESISTQNVDVAEDVAFAPYTPKSPGDKPDTLSVDVNQRNDAISYAEYISQGEGLESTASISPDGRISIVLDLKNDVPELPQDHGQDVEEFAVDRQWKDYPCMNIVVMIVGSRGDVQPYVALGQELVKDGHRVRIATHETFRTFVTDAGLEFFSIGGNPQDLMSYMVKNPGLMPGFESLSNGDIKRKREMLNEMINGCWLSCHSPCPVSGRSFVADAIISNPPAFAHVHCAEALGIPLLMSFTMPWSPTAAFPHPLVSVTTSNAGFGLSNMLSYAAADLLTWQGVGDIINIFRTTTLGISPLTLRSGPGILERVKVPWTYCMSPALVPKPDDWKNNIDVVGFYFLDLASNYQPSPELAAFLEAGEAPVYIGFGSVVVDDPAAMSQMIFDATEQAGVRALVSAGWGGLGGVSAPPHVFMLGNVPHDWLFDKERVSAVVHHGGAGTTAIGLAKGRPTVVVPFFGDQGFWGSMIHKAGAGPKPIPHKELSVKKLRDAIKFAVSPPAKEAAKQMSQKIHEENGVRRGVDSFYKHLPLLNMRCDLDPSRVAVWWSIEHCMKLSAFAVEVLAEARLVTFRSLALHRPKEYRTHKKNVDPSFGGAGTLFWQLTNQTRLGGLYQSGKSKAETVYDVSHGLMSAVASVHEGFKKQSASGSKSPRTKHERMNSVSSGVSESNRDSVAEPERIVAKKETLISSFKGIAQQLIVGKRPTGLGLVTLPVHKVWTTTPTHEGKTQEHQQRLTRLAEGREAVLFSTEAERASVLRRFKEEICETPLRQKMYRDAIQSAVNDGMELDMTKAHFSYDYEESAKVVVQPSSTSLDPEPSDSGSSSGKMPMSPRPISIPPGQVEAVDDEGAAFVQEMELAMKLSLEEYNRG